VTGSLLDTKLYATRRREGLVSRPHLTDRVRRGTRSKLTLVSAPAGFGKSTLLAEWLAVGPADGAVTAWLSLDPGDNQPVVFWINLIAALRTVAPTVGAKTLTLLESPGGSIEAALAPLLNDLNALPHDLVLVLDDYHAIDLRFTPDEASAFLNDVMSLALTPEDVVVLEGRTEGWIAAIQLAGLSMQGRDDVAGFIARFAGDDRYIVDYLVEEVLLRQPDPVRTFLLETSILSRLNGRLADAVTNREGGKAMLEALERQNMLLDPLDDQQEWYS